jgi:signal peptidase I
MMVYEEQDTSRSPVAHSAPVPPPSPDAAENASRPKERGLGFVRELAETILLTLVIFLAVRALVVNFRVEGDSMRPNLDNGQYLLVNKAVYFHFDLNAVRNLIPGQHHEGKDVVYLFHPPERGDIIVLNPPVRTDKPYIKRVIALPGETVAIHDGKVFIDGKPLNEPYIADPPRYVFPGPFDGGGVYTVPPDTVFVLGDNRNNSSDSHIFGPVSLDAVIGKAFFAYWPPHEAGLVPHERYNQSGQ